MDKSLKDQFLDFTLPPFPSGPEQILWAHALRNLINKNTALEPVSTQISPLLCPPFLLPPSPCFPSTPAFFCPESCHRSLHLPATSTGCKEAEMFEFAAAVKRRRLHLGITQVSLKIFHTTHLIWESKHPWESFCRTGRTLRCAWLSLPANNLANHPLQVNLVINLKIFDPLRFEALILPLSNMDRLQPLLQRWLKDSLSEAGRSINKQIALSFYYGEVPLEIGSVSERFRSLRGNQFRLFHIFSSLPWGWLPLRPGGKPTKAKSCFGRKCSTCTGKSLSTKPLARPKGGVVSYFPIFCNFFLLLLNFLMFSK